MPDVGQRLLFVDDEETILGAMKQYFRNLGYEVDCATEREEAEALMENVAYSCVIADLRLTAHGADGLEIVAHLREHAPETPIVILTAHGSSAIEEEAFRRGAAAFLNKPKPLADVARVVVELVGSAP